MFDSRISCRKTINNSFAHQFYVLAIEWANLFESNWQIYFTKWISNEKNTSPHRKRKVSIVKTTKIWRKFGENLPHSTALFNHMLRTDSDMPNLSNNLFNWNFVRHCYIVCLFLFHVLFLFMMNLFQIFKLPSCNWRGTTGSIKKGGPQNWVIEFINKAICSMVREQAWKSRTKKRNNNSANKQPTKPTRKCVSCS